MYALTLSIIIHLLLIIPLSAKQPVKQIINLSIKNIEFVPSKVMEQEEVVKTKSFHGKTKTKTVKKIVNKKLQVKGNEQAQKYFTKIREVFLKNFSSSKKAKKLKLAGNVLVKIQIQKNGSYDTLFVDGDQPELVSLANKTLAKIDKFPSIPDELEQQEIQLKIPLQYKFE